VVPEKFEKSIAVGKRVFVPFGRKRLTGYILAAMASSTFENIKEIIDVLDPSRFLMKKI